MLLDELGLTWLVEDRGVMYYLVIAPNQSHAKVYDVTAHAGLAPDSLLNLLVSDTQHRLLGTLPIPQPSLACMQAVEQLGDNDLLSAAAAQKIDQVSTQLLPLLRHTFQDT